MPSSNQFNQPLPPSFPVDEKGKPLDMPPDYFEAGEDEPVYERAQLSQNLWHHYAVR